VDISVDLSVIVPAYPAPARRSASRPRGLSARARVGPAGARDVEQVSRILGNSSYVSPGVSETGWLLVADSW